MLLMPKKRDVFCSELLFCCSAAPSFVREAGCHFSMNLNSLAQITSPIVTKEFVSQREGRE